MTPDLSLSLSLATPELIVALGAMALLMVGVYSGERANTTVTGLSVALLIAVAAWIVFFGGDGQAFGNAFISDGFARFMKVLTLVGSVVTLIMSVGFAKAEKFDKFEYPVLIMLSTLGMMLMISANSMIALYLGLELQSLALYVVAAINRDSVRSTEAGLKYFVLGALSSGMLLYGISSFMVTPEIPVSRRLRQRSAKASGSLALSSALCSCWLALPSRSRPCRSICGRRTSMKARRRR
jgi:NADH-quinone oxidoreductase subunit N